MAEHRYLDVEALKHVALMGGVRSEIRLTSSTLARALGITQQAASKRLMSLEKRCWVTRRKAPRAQYVSLTEAGKEVLLGELATYQQLFSPVSMLEVEGQVVSGKGRGQYFLSIPQYREGLEELLGYTPYEGTLNVLIDPRDVDKLSLLRGEKGNLISGFMEDGRSYGAAICFKAEISNHEDRHLDANCGLILPVKSKYWDVIELVSKHHLRRSLKLKDGTRVKVVVKL